MMRFNPPQYLSFFILFSLIGLLSACTAQGTIGLEFPTPTLEQSSDAFVNTRAMWVWDQNAIVDEAAREELFTFAADKGINTLFIFAFSLIRENPEALRRFIDLAGKQGFRVEFVAGAPEWAWQANHYIPLSFLRDTFEFSKSLPANHQLTGVVFDLEPYAVAPNDWPISEYLDLLEKLMETAQGSELTITVAVPFWFDIDDLRQPYRGVEQPLSQVIINMADRVLIMDYRDFADGGDGLISNIENEMAYAAAVGKPLIMGVKRTVTSLIPPRLRFVKKVKRRSTGSYLRSKLPMVRAPVGQGWRSITTPLTARLFLLLALRMIAFQLWIPPTASTPQIG
jgi:hypothetical protein